MLKNIVLASTIAFLLHMHNKILLQLPSNIFEPRKSISFPFLSYSDHYQRNYSGVSNVVIIWT